MSDVNCSLKGSKNPRCLVCYFCGCLCYEVDIRELVEGLPDRRERVT